MIGWLASLGPVHPRTLIRGLCGMSALLCLTPASAMAGTDGRTYEIVSPPDKNGYPVLHIPQQITGLSALSEDGDRAVFSSYGTFADSRSGMPTSYVSERTRDGWMTRAASPPPGKAMPNVLTGDASVWSVSNPALSFGITTTTDTLGPGDQGSSSDLYRVGIGETPSLISQGNNGERLTGFDAAEYAGMSTDTSRIYFRTGAHLVPGDASRSAGGDLYVRAGGTTTLVSQKADGTSVANCGAILGSSSPFGGTREGAISADDSRVTFTTPDPFGFGIDPDCSAPSHIYQRVNDAVTVDVSASQRATPDPGGSAAAIFGGASQDGETVILSSLEMLTDDALPGGGIYAYDVASRRLSVLVDTSDVRVLRVADDASRIYFLSSTDLDPGRGSPGVVKLFVYRADLDEVEYIAEDPSSTILNDVNVYPMTVNRQGDFVIGATGNLTSFDSRGFAEVYLYRAADSTLTCVSCDPAGQRLSTSRVRSNAITLRGRGAFFVDARPSFSSDGSRLIFESGDRLVPEDTNARSDVYEYAGEQLSLVSSGRSDNDSYAVGISADGATVMFATYESLVPQDRDGGNEDMYVARRGGGFPYTAPDEEIRCTQDACQGDLSPTPAAPIPTTDLFDGPEDSNTGGSGESGIRLISLSLPRARALRKAGRTGRVPIRVVTSGRGRVAVRLTARIPRPSTIGSASRIISSSGRWNTTLTVVLSRRARRLAAQGQLRATAQVLLNGKAAGRKRTITLIGVGSRGARR